MPLIAAQLQTLKADLAANTNTVVINGTATAINAVPHGAQNAQTIADWYNLTAAPDYFVWDSKVEIDGIGNAVLWSKYTPADSPPVSPSTDMTYQNRAMLLQTKQLNLQILLQGRDLFDATKVNLRSGLNDATTNLPSGTGGATQSGGWSAILPLLSRKARNVEKLFAFDDGAGIGNTTTDPRGASTNPDSPGYEGTISGADVLAAWAA